MQGVPRLVSVPRPWDPFAPPLSSSAISPSGTIDRRGAQTQHVGLGPREGAAWRRSQPLRLGVADGRIARTVYAPGQPARGAGRAALLHSLAFARARFAEPIRVRQGTAGSGARRVVFRALIGTCYVRTVCVLYESHSVSARGRPPGCRVHALRGSGCYCESHTCGTALGLLV